MIQFIAGTFDRLPCTTAAMHGFKLYESGMDYDDDRIVRARSEHVDYIVIFDRGHTITELRELMDSYEYNNGEKDEYGYTKDHNWEFSTERLMYPDCEDDSAWDIDENGDYTRHKYLITGTEYYEILEARDREYSMYESDRLQRDRYLSGDMDHSSEDYLDYMSKNDWKH